MAEDVFQFIVNRLESFLNSNAQILVNKERLEVVWMVKERDEAKGFLRIGKKHEKFLLSYDKNTGSIEMWINGIGALIFYKDTVEEFINEVKHEEAKRQ